MKSLLALTVGGADVRPLFPSVVKLVVTPHMELKRLVYMFLVHYGELEPDNILLSINTFQKEMRGPSALGRASALRVMSSIHVPSIVQLVDLAIKQSLIDSSPYVRQTAAHAIVKLHNLASPDDATLQQSLVQHVTVLLADAHPTVLGAALAAFNVVCPHQLDLLHGTYRRLCHLLTDIDSWGQIQTVHALTRYARTFFLTPEPDARRSLLDGQQGVDDSVDLDDAMDLDPDHVLLLRNVSLLLYSLNHGVVTAAIGCLLAVAAEGEYDVPVGRALARLCSSPATRELQYMALMTAATIVTTRPEVLHNHVADFFVFPNDPAAIASLKLEVCTRLVTPGTVTVILREFQTYAASEDKAFVQQAIQAIGRCALLIPDVAASCCRSLLRLLDSDDPQVAAEAVIVLKRLLQRDESDDHALVLRALLRRLPSTTVPAARAAIAWCAGEYHALVAPYVTDILRQLVASFATDADSVKLATIGLAGKLGLLASDLLPDGHARAVGLLSTHLFQLARFDRSFDVRDRARLVRSLLHPSDDEVAQDGSSPTRKLAPVLLVTEKPTVQDHSVHEDRAKFRLGSLSQLVNSTLRVDVPLPPFPTSLPDRSAAAARDAGTTTTYGAAVSSDDARSTRGPSTTVQPSTTRTAFDVDIDDFYADPVDEEEEEEEYALAEGTGVGLSLGDVADDFYGDGEYEFEEEELVGGGDDAWDEANWA